MRTMKGYGTQAYLIMQTETYVDGAPETVTDELANAATWAEQQAGSQNWGSGTNTYCELFVENAFGLPEDIQMRISVFRQSALAAHHKSPVRLYFLHRMQVTVN